MGRWTTILWLFWGALAVAEPTEQALIARGVPVIRKQLSRSHAVLPDTLPEYDPQTEFLFHFYPDGHAVLYAGGSFRESNEEERKEGERIIHNGVAVKSKIGSENVERLVSAMTHSKFSQSRNTFTCQQRLFYLLQEAGIGLKDGPYLLGTTTYQKLLEQGFTDANGKAFPHSVVALETEGTDLIPQTFLRMTDYEVGQDHGFFQALRHHFAYGNAEMLEDVKRSTTHPEALAWVNATAIETGRPPMNSVQRSVVHSVLANADKKFLAKVQAGYGGVTLNQLFHSFTRTDIPAEHQAAARDLFRQSMQEAMLEVLAPLNAPGTACGAVASAAG